jgi:predicted enzyme related to lactoylglutathione lyase
MSKMNSVVHFEMPYDDRERMAKFYRDTFGWQTRFLGEEMGNYVLATTTESDESGPKQPDRQALAPMRRFSKFAIPRSSRSA